MLDTAAVAVLLGGWLPVAMLGWRRRHELVSRVGQLALGAGTFLAGLGSGLVIASAFADFEGWWLVGAALLVAVQVVGLLTLARRSGACLTGAEPREE